MREAIKAGEDTVLEGSALDPTGPAHDAWHAEAEVVVFVGRSPQAASDGASAAIVSYGSRKSTAAKANIPIKINKTDTATTGVW